MPPHRAARGPARSYLPYIRVNLAQVARARNLVHKKGKRAGEVNIYAVHMQTGVPYDACWNLVKNGYSPHLGLATIAKFCHTLDTTPGELLDFVPNPDYETYTLPRAKLNPGDETLLINW